jgi:hypothetical protein
MSTCLGSFSPDTHLLHIMRNELNLCIYLEDPQIFLDFSGPWVCHNRVIVHHKVLQCTRGSDLLIGADICGLQINKLDKPVMCYLPHTPLVDLQYQNNLCVGINEDRGGFRTAVTAGTINFALKFSRLRQYFTILAYNFEAKMCHVIRRT